MKKVYLAGDLCQIGNVLLREKESEYARKEGIEIYSPIEDKEINNKHDQTEESNKFLCDKIYSKDMKAIRESEYITMDIANTSVGTVCELGAIAEFNWFWEEIAKILQSISKDNKGYEECFMEVWSFLQKHPKKKLYCYSSDIRDTDIAESGHFRSHSYNQFIHGAVRKASVSENFEKDFKECIRKIKED